MKKTKLSIFVLTSLASATIIFVSCKKTEAQPQDQFNEVPNLDASYDYYSKHKVNSDVATLGRVLFYDRKLSSNNAVSCGSCHKQEFAFADNVQFNKGFNGVALTRNSPSIQGIKGFLNVKDGNKQFWGRPVDENQTEVLLFWDGRQNKMSDMVLNPVLNHKEMNIADFASLEKKLSETSYYPDLFTKAYGDPYVSTKRIAFALQGFMACLNTDSLDPKVPNQNATEPGIFFEQITKFDQFGNPIKTLPTSTLTGLAEEGRKLFHTKYNCAKCHDPSDPSDPSGGDPGEYGSVTVPLSPDVPVLFNIGLDEIYTDKGLGNITGKAGDHGLFKVPTLKNIAKTAPYMHDGRFKNLSEVIDHYSHNIKDNKNLSPLFRAFNGQPKKLNISAVEKQAIIAFLNTLTDTDFLTNPMYSDPFKK